MTFTRREMLAAGGALGAVLAAGVVVPVSLVLSDDDAESSGATGAMLSSFPRTRIGSLSDLRVGEPQFFEYPLEGQSNILVALGAAAIGGIGADRDVVAYSNVCTHMGCPITEFVADHGVLGPCPCHFTSFDLGRDGQVVLGQATQNLPRVLLEVEDEDIYAMGVYRLVYGHHNTLGGLSVQAAS